MKLAIGLLTCLTAFALLSYPTACMAAPAQPTEIKVIINQPWPQLLATLLSAAASLFAVLIAIWFFLANRSTTRYIHLADIWYAIKQDEFQHPDFTDENKTKSYQTSFQGNELRRYEVFAWRCWGHAEDVFLNGFHNDPGFRPSIRWYKQLHTSWLLNNTTKFDVRFYDYVQRL